MERAAKHPGHHKAMLERLRLAQNEMPFVVGHRDLAISVADAPIA
jgi:hypothetical protein